MGFGDQNFFKNKKTPPVNFFGPPFFLAGLFLDFWQVFVQKKDPLSEVKVLTLRKITSGISRLCKLT
ncbi:hypothetical protein K0U83_19170, partial [bacterium]|nr:hypothetical protein [bacterium]